MECGFYVYDKDCKLWYAGDGTWRIEWRHAFCYRSKKDAFAGKWPFRADKDVVVLHVSVCQPNDDDGT